MKQITNVEKGDLSIVVCGFDDEGRLVHMFGGNDPEDVKKIAETFPYHQGLAYMATRPELISVAMTGLIRGAMTRGARDATLPTEKYPSIGGYVRAGGAFC